MKRIMIVAIALVLALVCCVSAVSAAGVTDSGNVVVSGDIASCDAGFSIDVSSALNPVVLDKSVPAGTPVQVANVAVTTSGTGCGWTLDADGGSGFMYDGVSSYLHWPAQIARDGGSYNQLAYDVVTAADHHPTPIVGFATGAGSTGGSPVQVWFNQRMDASDPNTGTYTITLTFTGTTL